MMIDIQQSHIPDRKKYHIVQLLMTTVTMVIGHCGTIHTCHNITGDMIQNQFHSLCTTEHNSFVLLKKVIEKERWCYLGKNIFLLYFLENCGIFISGIFAPFSLSLLRSLGNVSVWRYMARMVGKGFFCLNALIILEVGHVTKILMLVLLEIFCWNNLKFYFEICIIFTMSVEKKQRINSAILSLKVI